MPVGASLPGATVSGIAANLLVPSLGNPELRAGTREVTQLMAQQMRELADNLEQAGQEGETATVEQDEAVVRSFAARRRSPAPRWCWRTCCHPIRTPSCAAPRRRCSTAARSSFARGGEGPPDDASLRLALQQVGDLVDATAHPRGEPLVEHLVIGTVAVALQRCLEVFDEEHQRSR